MYSCSKSLLIVRSRTIVLNRTGVMYLILMLLPTQSQKYLYSEVNPIASDRFKVKSPHQKRKKKEKTIRKTIKHSPTAFWHAFRVVLYCFQRCNPETLAGQNVSCSSRKGTPAERGHHEAILAFMSMIDDTGMEAAFEKSPLLREKWWLFGFFFPDSIPLCFSVGHFHNALYSRTQARLLVLYTSSHNNCQNQKSNYLQIPLWCLWGEI